MIRETEYLGIWGSLDVLRRAKIGRTLDPWIVGRRDRRWDDVPLLPVGARTEPAAVEVALGRGDRKHHLRLPIVTGLGNAPMPWYPKASTALLEAAQVAGTIAYLPDEPPEDPSHFKGGVWRCNGQIPKTKMVLADGIEIAYQGQPAFADEVNQIKLNWPEKVLWVKVAASHRLTTDMAAVIDADPDVILLVGKDSPLYEAPVALVEGLGISLYDALRGLDWRNLTIQSEEGRPSLVVSGSLSSPAHVMKALVLGADACALPIPCLWAFTGRQVSKALPLEPLESLVLKGAPAAPRLDWNLAGRSLVAFLQAMEIELSQLCGELGLKQVSDVHTKHGNE